MARKKKEEEISKKAILIMGGILAWNLVKMGVWLMAALALMKYLNINVL